MSNALRVLHVSTWNVRCGIATYCANLVKSLDALGVENDIFPLEPHRWPNYLPSDINQLTTDLVNKAKGFDLVHIQHEHGLFGASLGMRYAAKQFGRILAALRATGVPVITTFHTEVRSLGRKNGKLLLRLKDWIHYRRCYAHVGSRFGTKPGQARAIVHSPQTRYTFAKVGVPANSIHVMRHACLPKRKETIDKSEAKARLGIAPHEILLTMFGFVGEYKGHDLAMDALQRLPANYRLAICGGSHPESRDNFLSKLLKTIKTSQLADRVMITGWIPAEVAELYYAATDVCLAPYRVSSNLSASGAITWALSSGRPVVASRIDAFQEIQRESDCMFMVTPEAPVELAWAIETLLNDPVQQSRLVEAADQYIDRFSWSRTAEQIVGLYESMVAERSSPQIQLHKAA